MLLLPAFDTYKCLDKFAKDPCEANQISLSLLKTRAIRETLWSASIGAQGEEHLDALLDLRLGWSKRYQRQAKASGFKSMDELAKLSRAEQQDYMLKCMQQAGVSVDPSLILERNKNI